MSKYYKIEDVINKYAEMIVSDAYWEYGVGDGKVDEDSIDIAKMYFADLPTIEVVFCEECKYAPYCEQHLVKEIFGNEIADWREVDFCQHGERIEE